MKKLLAIGLSVVMTLATLAGCGTSSSSTPSSTSSSTEATQSTVAEKEPTTIELWHLFPEDQELTSFHQRYTAWAKDFNASNTDKITVKVSGGKTADVIMTTIASGSTPDIFMNYWNNAPAWSDAGALYDLTKFANEDAAFDKADFIENTWNLCTYKDVIYSIPNSYSSSFIFYRADMLAKAGYTEFPKTMDELAKCIEDLTIVEKDGTISQMGMIPDYPWLDSLMWSTAFGAEFLDKATNKVTFDSDKMISAFKFQKNIYDKYGYDKVKRFVDTLGGRATAQDPLLTGKVAMRWNSETVIPKLEQFGADIDWKIALFPDPTADSKGSGMFTSNVWQMNAKTKNPEAAWAALSSFTSSDNMKKLAEGEVNNGAFYARRSALTHLKDTLKVSDNTKFVAGLLLDNEFKSFPMISYINPYLDAISTEIQKAFKGEKTVEEAAAAVVKQIQPMADKDAKK